MTVDIKLYHSRLLAILCYLMQMILKETVHIINKSDITVNIVHAASE